MDDYYKILGVDRGASESDIKSAYRKLAHKYHPDKAGGDDKMFKRINEAYQVLSNREKRAQYDRFGRTFSGNAGSGPAGDASDWRNFGNGFEFGFDFGGFGENENLSDVFDAFFEGLGVKRKRRTYERGSDLELIEEVTLEEVFRGARKPLKFKTHVKCEMCSGLGHFPKDGFTSCSACDGRGEIQESRRTFFGNFTQVKTCGKCVGLGKIPNKICSRCAGIGRLQSDREVELTIAPGVADDQLIKIAGAGESGPRGASAGDLYVRINIKPHLRFTRVGDDLLVKEEVTLVDLLVDRTLQVKTISGGAITVHIPPGFRLGDRITVPGEGMPRLGTSLRGSLFVELDVKLPKRISERAKELLEELKGELE